MVKRVRTAYSGRRRREPSGAADAATPWPNVILATIGLRQKKARMAASRLQAKAAQRTGSQEPVTSSSLAARRP